jgi:hypothetical protein
MEYSHLTLLGLSVASNEFFHFVDQNNTLPTSQEFLKSSGSFLRRGLLGGYCELLLRFCS